MQSKVILNMLIKHDKNHNLAQKYMVLKNVNKLILLKLILLKLWNNLYILYHIFYFIPELDKSNRIGLFK